MRRVVATTAVILAVVVVTTISIDLGPALRARAETAATNYLKRPVHIGGLSIRLWNGRYQVHDITIAGLTPESPPFLTARLVTVSMPWSTLVNRRIVFDTIEMTDWKMVVENLQDGRNSFPRLPPRRGAGRGRGRRRCSTCGRIGASSSTTTRPRRGR